MGDAFNLILIVFSTVVTAVCLWRGLTISELRSDLRDATSSRDAFRARLNKLNTDNITLCEINDKALTGWAKDGDARHRAEGLIGDIAELIERYDEGECEEGR